MESNTSMDTSIQREPALAAREIWDRAYQILLDQQDLGLTPREFNSLSDVNSVSLFDTMLVLTVSVEFTRTVLESKLRYPLTSALSTITGRSMTYVVQLDPSILAIKPENTISARPQASSVSSITTQSQAINVSPSATAEPATHYQIPIPVTDEPITSSFAVASSTSTSTSLSDDMSGFTALPINTPNSDGADAVAILQATHSAQLVQSQQSQEVPSSPLSAHDPSHSGSPALSQAAIHVLRDEYTHLNTNAVFDNFVPGDSNRFARAVALAVAEAPGRSFNPLCIYGGSGLGKTHLLNAIGNYVKKENPHTRVRYANSEEFTNEFINALQNSAHDNTLIPEFNRRYREVDVLLIDDVQFLAGKDATMEQFFHTFNSLHNNNKQIVIASDVAPKNLKGFEDRLISRFESGLTVDIKPPNRETRIAILRMKAQNSRITIPSDVLDLIAEQVTDNIRELEGALTRVTAMASLNGQEVTRALAEQTLQDYFNSDVEITPTDIITYVAQYFKLTFDDLVGVSRTKNVAMARQIAMYMSREMTALSLVDIGEIFGGRDHSTVMHAYKKISSEMAEKREVYNSVKELTTHLKQKGK